MFKSIYYKHYELNYSMVSLVLLLGGLGQLYAFIKSFKIY